MEEKLSGIVLGGVNYGESDKILNIFTLEKGTISAKIKGVKKAGAKLKFASEPFCFVEFVFSTTGDRRTVIGASLIDSFYPLREDLIKFYSAGAVVDFIKKFEKESIVSADMFLLTVETLKNLAYKDTCTLGEITAFFIKALKIAGYSLNLDGCFTCGKKLSGRIYFDYYFGGFFCDECKGEHAREINLSTYLALQGASENNLDSSLSFEGAIRLINYYIINRAEEKLNSLTELIKLIK